MPASHARLIVGLSAVDEFAWTMIASGFALMMLLSESIWACSVPSTCSTLRSTRPASGPLSTATCAERSICWSQSLPIVTADR